jgi:Holliday junction resolvase RusA-like endonuclease
MLTVVLNIEPRPAPRPRVTRWGAYNDPRYTAYKELIAKEIKQVMKISKLSIIKDAISLNLEFHIAIPKSYTKKQKQDLIGKFKTSKPDIDNYIKGVMDALNGVCWIDDAQVCQITAVKHYSHNGSIKINLSLGSS